MGAKASLGQLVWGHERRLFERGTDERARVDGREGESGAIGQGA